MSEVKIIIDEINEIETELKRLSSNAKKLRNHKKELEHKVKRYLENNETKGFRYGSTAVVLQTTTTRKRKVQKDKFKDVNDLLKESGIYDDNLAKQIIEKTRGVKQEDNKLKIMKTT